MAQVKKGGEEALGLYRYENFERPVTCRQCHIDIYEQWAQSMMAQAYTHHWDEIEYFELAVPHALKDAKVAGVREGCNLAVRWQVLPRAGRQLPGLAVRPRIVNRGPPLASQIARWDAAGVTP